VIGPDTREGVRGWLLAVLVATCLLLLAAVLTEAQGWITGACLVLLAGVIGFALLAARALDERDAERAAGHERARELEHARNENATLVEYAARVQGTAVREQRELVALRQQRDRLQDRVQRLEAHGAEATLPPPLPHGFVFRSDVEAVRSELLTLDNPFALWLVGRIDQLLAASGSVVSVSQLADAVLRSEPAGWAPGHVAEVTGLLAERWTNAFARELVLAVARYGLAYATHRTHGAESPPATVDSQVVPGRRTASGTRVGP
jgi:3-phenylpropionate/cinnamic acid dioxygenase small subunit